MNFTLENILLSLVFSAIGFVYVSYGKKMGQLVFAVCGVLLMIYPYFVDSPVAIIGLGIVFAVIPFAARRFGW